jgi:predicted dehydrogenase
MTRHLIAVIGLGMAVTPHARSLLDLRGRVEVAHAFSRSEARRRAFGERFDFPTTGNLERIVGDASVDAVMILTPPNTHLELVERFARAGKHILLEKPLERSTPRALRLVETAEAAGVKLGVVFQHRFQEASERLRELLQQDALGQPAAANVISAWWRPQSYYDEPGRGTLARDGGGVLLTQAIHSLDLFRSLVGVSSVVAADVRTTDLHRMEAEDYVSALLRLGNGSPGTLMATTAAYPGHPERIEVLGTKGFASLIGGTLRLTFLDGREEIVEAEGSTGSGASIMDFPHDAHRALVADFVDAIHCRRQPTVSGEEALASQRLVSAVLAGGKGVH